MSNQTVITKQLYNLRGNKKTNGTYLVSVIDTLDENKDECVCRVIDKNGEKSFIIIQKNDDSNTSQDEADVTYGGKAVTNVSYIESGCGNTRFVRYVIGDQTDEKSLESFFEAVHNRLTQEFAFRGWSVDHTGVLTIKKPEYFY